MRLRTPLAALAACLLAACGGGGTDASSPAPVESRARKAIERVFTAEAPQRVNTTTAGEQSLRALGALADGGHAVAWRSGESAWALQRYDAAGLPAGAETAIAFAGLPASTLGGASAAVLPNGHVVLAYVDAREVPRPPAPPLLEVGVFLQRFDGAGQPVQVETPVAAMTFEPHSRSPGFGQVQALALSDGGFVVAWGLLSPSSVTIRHTFSAQRFDAAGQALGEATPLGRPASPGEASYRLWADAWGGFTAAVLQLDEAYQPDHSLIHFAPQATQRIAPVGAQASLLALQGGRLVRFDAEGAGAYLQLIEPTGQAGRQVPLPALPVAARELADGRFAVLWPEGGGLRAQVFGSDGKASGPPVASAAGAAPEMAALADGGFVAAWSAGAEPDVYTQRFEEVPLARNAARVAHWKACTTRAKGMKGQARKQFLDACSAD